MFLGQCQKRFSQYRKKQKIYPRVKAGNKYVVVRKIGAPDLSEIYRKYDVYFGTLI